jgi:hypothetical protein
MFPVGQFYLDDDEVLKVAQAVSEVPEDVEDWTSVGDAVSYVQHLGCAGFSQHKIKSDYHKLCLAVLRWAVENIGEAFPTVLRGVRSQRSDKDSLILFGTTDREVAKFYAKDGKIKVYRNIKGLKTMSTVKSVKTDDWADQGDEEIIFFPEDVQRL